MKKKTIILLMISLVMILSVSAISAADANDTLQEQVSDTDIETISSDLEAGDTATSTLNEAGTDVEKISASEAQIEKSNQKEDNASFKSNDDVLSASSDDVLKADKENNLNNDVLAASSDDVLGDNPNFYYNGQSYEDLADAVSDACDNNGGTIQITARTWGYDSAEREITISKGVSITFEPIDADAEVIFDGNDYSGNVNNRWWFFKIDDKNARVTFNRITFRNGGDGSLACDGGAIRIVHGQVTMTDCIFDNNKASENKLGGYGLGGAIYLDESDASLNAYNCTFTNNNADNGGGAVFVEDGATASFENCYFEGNKADGSINHVQTDEGDGSSYSFTDCLFKGDGSIGVTKNPLQRQVEISPEVNDDDADHIILYKDGAEYARKSYDGADVTFGDLETLLEPGKYTVYMAKGDAYSTEKRYDYNKQFTIVEPNFVLTKGEDTDVFETLKQAIAAIDNGESGEIYVAGGTWNGTDNLGLYVSNKIITIMPKPAIMPKPVDASDDEPVVFLGLEESYFLSLDYGQLIMNDINIIGGFTGAALNFNYCTECYISDCAFDNIGHLATIITPYPNPSVTYYVDGPGFPIYAYCTTLALDECTFDSSKQSLFRNSTVNITDCEYTNNSGLVGGAINADSTSNLTITGSEFSLNEATDRGGAIFATNLKINYTEFIGNIAPIGGAIYITNQSDSEVNISCSVFDSNIAETYRNIYTESATREITLMFNEYDLNLAILEKDGVYGVDYIMETVFDWGVNLNNNDTLILGTLDDETPFLELVDIEGDKFTLNLGVLSGGPHNIILDGMYTQGDSMDHFVGQDYYTDLNGNEFYLNKWASLQFNIEKAKIALNLTVENVLIPKIPVLNLYANFDENFTVFLGTTVYHVQVVNGKGSLELTGLDLGNYTVVAMRSSDENFELALNFTTFTVSKAYSNFLVLSTNVEYKTLKEAIVNSNDDDTIYIKKGTYNDTGIVISNKTLDIIALEGAVFDAQGHDANFIIVTDTAEATIYGITFRGIHNRNTNYGAIVNHGYLTVNSCNFTDNTITKTSFAENGGAAIFSDGELLEIDNCNFINNVAPLKASTAAVTSLGYEDVSITSSRFINNTAREGGALHFKNLIQFESAVSSCDFEQNTAIKGSAIYVGNNSRYVSVTLSGFSKNDIKNNKGENAELEGGVIYVNANDAEATLDISLSNFESNSNKDVDGGVICLDGTSNANIDTCIFKDNKGKVGSVILVKNPYNEKLRLFIESSVLANNSATRGAIATSPKVTAFLDECVFADNTGEYRNIYSNGFTVAHDSIFDVKDAELNAMNVKYGENSIISGAADTGTNLYAAANLTVAGENVILEIRDNAFTYTTGILNNGKYHAVLNGIVDYNNNTYVMDSITKIFRVNKATIDLNVSVDNITYGESVNVTETLPANVDGTVGYYLNGVYYTKEELESLKLDVGKYTLVAYYNHEDYEPAYSLIDFEVYKAKANISVADVEVESNESIILNIETNAPSIYTIEIGKYKLITLINASKSIEVDETFAPGTYTIRVTSKERVNYMSTSTEAILKVKDEPLLVTSNNVPEQPIVTSLSTSQSPIDNSVLNRLGAKNLKLNSQDDLLIATNNDLLSDEESFFDDYEETGNFIYQEDEDDDPQYFDTLEEAIDEASLMGGIITVRGGTYNGWGFCGIDIEGELEITIKAYPGEEVIFDCEGEDYFLHLTYDTEVEMIETVPPIPIVYTTEGPTITLENITVINGYNSEGGAIELVAGTLTMINCNFYNNFAEDYGGAICIGSMNSDQDATVIALNCTFMNNIAGEEGGAIYIEADWEQESTASFAFCTFLDNFQGEEGSRTRNYFAGPEVNEITSQYCLFDGTGEIYSVDIDKIEQIVIVNGTSPDPFDSVVLLYNNTLPLYTAYNNGSRDFYVTFEDVIGGNYTLGVMNDHNFNTYIFGEPFEVKVANFFISKDDVFENLTDAIEAVEENGIIYANFNYHIEENMEIDITKSFTIKNYKGRMVIFDGNATQWFFTVAEGCNVVFEGVNFTDGGMNNFASFENKGTLTFKDCIFSDFETGAIIYNTGILNIINSEFSDNTLYSAIVLNEGKLSIDSSTFTGNIINTNSVIFNNGIADITSSTFTENINFGNGGAIYSTNSLNITDTVFRENEGIDGGAIYNTGTMQVKNSTFEDNTANGYGGAIYNEGELNVFDSTFTGGFSERDGGAIYNNNVANVDNSTFIANTATGNGGAIYNNKKLVLTDSFFGINYGEEFANIYNAGNIEFTGNTFDFYDVILYVPYGQYDIPTVITGTLDPQFNMDVQLILPGFVNNTDALAYLQEGIFEYDTGILPKGIYTVKLDEIVYDTNGNVYYGEAVTDRLIINKANVTLNITVDDIVLKDASQGTPVLKINASKDGIVNILFNNKLITVNITDNYAEITLDSVEEGNYSVMVFRAGDENYNDAVNTTTFKVSEYEGNFIVDSGGQFDTLREAIDNAADEDIIYVREGNYTGADNLGLTVSDKKLTITPLGEVVFDAELRDLSFLTIDETSDVTLEDITITGFHTMSTVIISNNGNLIVDGCVFANNNLGDSLIDNYGDLTVVESSFYDNDISIYLIYSDSQGRVIINESSFESNIAYFTGYLLSICYANSAKIISNDFVENKVSGDIIYLKQCSDVLIDSVFTNNTKGNNVIWAYGNSNLLVENSVFTGNELSNIISSTENNQIIKDCTFTDNTVKHVVDSTDDKLTVIGSTFSANTVSGNGTLYTTSNDVTIDDCLFTGNKADDYRNIYSVSTDVKITNNVFDAINVDYSVYDIDYAENETIEGTIDIGTNLNFTVNLKINSKTYSVNVTDNKFAYNLIRPSGGDYTVILDSADSNSNSFVFDQITRTFTVNRVDPNLKVIIPDINQGEKLNVTLFGNRTNHVVFELNGKSYTNETLQDLTLAPGDYLIIATFAGDRNYLPATVFVNVKVHKVTPNITVNDVVVDYGDDVKIDAAADAADYYTAIIGNETLTLYVRDKVTFTFPALDLKPGIYEIIVYVFENNEHAEAYANATLTVNKADGVFRLNNDIIIEGENATVSVNVPLHADGNITYNVFSEDLELVYNITQSCLEELVVPGLSTGNYMVTGTYSGDAYYTDVSKVTSGTIYVNTPKVDLTVTASEITYGEPAVITVNSKVDGEYLVWVDGENFTVNVIDGTGNVSVPNLNAGNHTANAKIIHEYYVAYNEAVFEVAPKPVWVVVSVEDIVQGEDAIVHVYGEIDGKYIVEVNNQTYTVNVTEGEGNTTVSDLNVVGDMMASVSIDENNYAASDNTTFNVASKEVTAIVTVGNIVYGDDAVVIVQSNVSGDYIVTIRDVNYTVSVNGGNGVIFVSNLTAGNQIPVTVKRDDRYTAFNKTAFDISPKMANVELAAENITWNENAVINITAEIDGSYILTVNNVEYPIEVTGGKASQVITGLAAKNYDAQIVIVNGNYSASNKTEFNVAPKPVTFTISVENITYQEEAAVIVKADVDGEYPVYVGGEEFTVTVKDGIGSVSVYNLTVGSYDANVSAGNGNYTGSDSTTFAVAVKKINVSVSVEDIVFKDDAIVIVKADVDGEYLVYVDEASYTVSVSDGIGNVTVDGLTAGSHAANVTVVDGNCTGSDSTTFTVGVKKINVSVSVEDIYYGESAVVNVEADVDGEYLVNVTGNIYTVNVVDGKGNTTISDLEVNEGILVTVVIADGNYTAYNTTTFNVILKNISVTVSVSDITYGEDAVVIVQSDFAGDYIVNIRNINYTVSVNGGNGVIFIQNLSAGNQIAVTVKRDDNYTAFNETAFNINQKQVNVKIDAENITWNESAIINISAEIDGNYILTVNNVEYPIEVTGGKASQVISGLAAKNYDAQIVIVNGNYSASNKTEFNVAPKPVNVIISVEGITYGDEADVTVKSDVDGEYLVYVDDVNYTVVVSDGVGNVPVGGLTVGDHVAAVGVVDGNYSGSNFTTFAVAVKPVNVSVTVADIVYGDEADVTVKSDVDGEYLVYVDETPYTVIVTEGVGNVTVGGLTVGSHAANVTVVDGNYSGSDSATFAVAVKPVNVTVTVEGITYGDEADVIVKSDVDGEYLVYVDDAPYTVIVAKGVGNVTVGGLTAGDHAVNVTVVDGNYSGSDSATFAVAVKPVNVSVTVADIVYGDKADVIVKSDVDGEYLVYVDDAPYTVIVAKGVGNVTVGGLTVGSHAVNVTVVDGNYSGSDSTTFNVAIKKVNVTVTVADIVYGDEADVTVKSDVDGEYLVYVDETPYTVIVTEGVGNVTVGGLTAGDHVANVTVVDKKYFGSDSTTFAVAVKAVNVTVAVEDIVYGDKADVTVKSDVDGEYLVYVDDAPYTVIVSDGVGNLPVGGLTVGSHAANVTVVDGNYSGSDSTTFAVAVKPVNVSVTVADIVYGDKADVIVKSDVDGEYLVYVDDAPYTVIVAKGVGNVTVGGLTVGSHAANVTVVDGNYSGSDSATFAVAVKPVNVSVAVADIVYGDKADVIVKSDVDGEYLVYVDDAPYTVIVAKGVGNVTVGGLTVGSHAVNVTVVDGNYSGSDSTTFNVAIKKVNVTVTVADIVYTNKADVIVKSDVDGEYLVYVDDAPYTVIVAKGVGNVTVGGLTVGSHAANVTVVDGNYSGSDSATFAVAVKQVNVTVSVEDIAYGSKADVTVKSDVDGEYLVYVDDAPYTVIVSDGVGNAAVGGLSVGNHTASVTVVDGNYSGSDSTTFNVSKAKTEVDLKFDNETTGTPLLEFRLPSDAGGNVSVYVNDKLSQVVNLTNGSANIIVTDLNIGSNNVTVVYSGDDNYDSLNKSFTITRKATIEAYDMTRGYNSGLDYTAKLYGADGSPLANANVTIKVGTNTYTVLTDSSGVFVFNNKLAAGDYAVAVVNPETGEYKLTNLKIVKRITGNKDVKIFFADNSKYKVRAVGDDGEYVGAGEIVKMNVGGKTYSVKTDKNGYATLKLSLKVKTHTITVTYKGFTTKNKVTVKSVVKPVKKTVKVKKTAKKLKIKVKLKGKKVLKKKRVYLKFKGKTYKAKTNKKGIATFKVPKKVIKKLKKGKKYTAKFTYKAKSNGKTIKNTAKCKVKVK